MTASKAWISGCAGTRLNGEEKAFFADERPWGFILFGRNIASAEQVRDLVAELKEAGGRADTPVLIDQEGSRVQRLRPPLAPNYPSPAHIGRVHAKDASEGRRAAWLQGRLIAADLRSFGINVDCVPCLDVPVEGAHSVIGDRAYGIDPVIVATLGRAAAEGLMAGGVAPVMKHIPGHGRGNADSHLQLPVVDTSRADLEQSDFRPFVSLRDLPAAMTAHLLFTALDPSRPATLSPTVIAEVVRGIIGFDGLLMTDDLSMKALAGDAGHLAATAIGAGCDLVLHCNGDMAEMRRVASAVPDMAADASRRAGAVVDIFAKDRPHADVQAMRSEFEAIVSAVA